jgi:hypothetical protein
MKNNSVLQLVLFVLVLSLITGCKSGTTSKDDVSEPENMDLTVDKITEGEIIDELGEGIPVYYNMYLTVELSSLFENEGASYQQDILNSVEKAKEYITSSEKALNLGVYAVDLSYARVFEQYQKAGSFFSAMTRLSEELGIPQDFIYETSDRLENNISDKDSLNKIANEIYMATDNYLRENDRENAAALIIAGGWVEALYLASEVFDLENENEDFEYMERIIEQKHSLANLVELLAGFESDETISALLPQLKELQPSFESFMVDKENINNSVEQLNAINEKVTEIRNTIIG